MRRVDDDEAEKGDGGGAGTELLCEEWSAKTAIQAPNNGRRVSIFSTIREAKKDLVAVIVEYISPYDDHCQSALRHIGEMFLLQIALDIAGDSVRPGAGFWSLRTTTSCDVFFSGSSDAGFSFVSPHLHGDILLLRAFLSRR